MKILIVAGFLAIAAAQKTTTIDPSVLLNIFGTPPTPTGTVTRRPLEEVLRNSRNVNVGSVPTIKPSLLTEVFGTPPTPKSSRQTHEDMNSTRNVQDMSNVKSEGITTIKTSVLTEIFGTPPTPKSSRLTYEEVNSTRNTQDTRNLKSDGTPGSASETHMNAATKKEAQDIRSVHGDPTIEPSLLIEVFGTPPLQNSSRSEDDSTKKAPQETRPSQDISTGSKVLGTPPTLDVSRNGYENRNSENTQGTRNVNVDGIPTIDPSLLIDVFGTAPTPKDKSSREGFEDITVKPTEGTSTFVDRDGQSCQCVPYYLCDSNNVGVDVNNASVTGWGTLDIRFGDDDNTIDRQCQESVEVCCSIPKDLTEVPKPAKPLPQPDPTKVKGCGYRNPQGLGVTITGGTGAESQFGEFPWVVALLDSRNSSYVGVGVLIHPQVVMTGAHIAQKYGPGELKIRAGEWDTQTVKEIYPYEERVVENTIIHENFMPKSLKNDIALLRLESPLEISEHINVICMPDYEEVFDSSKNCVANGWGKSHFGQSNRYAVILKKVEVDMVPYNRCNALLKRTRLGHNFKLHNSFVCAGGEAGKDTCQGDGGAPLACPIGNNRYKLTGLVAWGIGCGQQDVPAVYTNVPLFRQWVDNKMADWNFEATSYRIPE